MKKFFGTDGIRQEAEKFTPNFLQKIAEELAKYGGEKMKVLIGGDTRESSEWIINDLEKAFEGLGIEYGTVGVLPTPAEQTFRYNVEYMMTGPVIAIVLEGVEAVPLVRKIVGPTEPKSAEMGTIRGDFSHMSFGYSDAKGTGVPNLVHASGNTEEAEKEINLWFNGNELYDYSDLNEKYTR